MEMKWLFVFAALYVVIIAKVPDQCDVKTTHQCSKEEILILSRLESKTDAELQLLLEMESTETELVNQRFLQSLSYIVNEIRIMENKISLLTSLYSEETLKFNEKMSDLKKEYRSDLTRRLLASERGKSASVQNQLGM
jgi:hypothetical protein